LQGKGPAAQTYFEYNDDKLREIAQLFDGSNNKASEADRLEGMKRLIAVSPGANVLAVTDFCVSEANFYSGILMLI
jgi:hypothetical protein